MAGFAGCSGTRYAAGHRWIWFCAPAKSSSASLSQKQPNLYYLPYKFDGQKWTEFPQELAEYEIRTTDGPRSQKDGRSWATGRIEYSPQEGLDQPSIVIDMPSPYVIIDAHFSLTATLPAAGDGFRVETSTDGGQTWIRAGELSGPHSGAWSTEPKVIVTSQHGRLTAVSGTYGYKVRITTLGHAKLTPGSLHLLSRIQLNPRSLPAVRSGDNRFVFSSASAVERVALPAPLKSAAVTKLAYVCERGQAFLNPTSSSAGEINYILEGDGRTLKGFDAGARSIDLTRGLAPDKLTAETRRTEAFARKGEASIAWAVHPEGPFRTVWNYPQQQTWPDGIQMDRLLDWPESFTQIRSLPSGTKRVYLKFKSSGPAIDDVRLAVYLLAPPPSGKLSVVQVWREGQVRHEHLERIAASEREHVFTVPAGRQVTNEAVTMTVN